MQLLTTLLVLSVCLFPNLAAAATPHIYDAPNAGPPGSQTSTVGNGWDANATLDIYLDSTNVGLVDTDNNGTFGMTLKAPTIRQNGLTIQIPKDAVPGQHWITAVERITQLQAQAPFTVRTDWPQLQFDVQHTGFNPYENVVSPANVGKLATDWTFAMFGGEIAGALTVVNDVIYFGTQVGGGIFALDANTGKQLWMYATTYNGGAPAVANGMLYYTSGEQWCDPWGYVFALNAQSGVPIWQYQVCGGAPAVANGVVYVSSGRDGNLYALDANTGALRWKFAGAWAANNTTVPAVANGVVYVGGQADNYFYALDASSGALLWKFADQGTFGAMVGNGVVYVTANLNDIYALKADTGAVIWKSTMPGLMIDNPAVANGMLYVGSVYSFNGLYALDAGTGALRWTYETGQEGVNWAPTVANGVLYAAYRDGTAFALDASTGALLWNNDFGFAPYMVSATVVNGTVYIGNATDNVHTYIYAFGLPNQEKSEKFNPPQRPDPARLTPHWSLQPNSQATPPLKK